MEGFRGCVQRHTDGTKTIISSHTSRLRVQRTGAALSLFITVDDQKDTYEAVDYQRGSSWCQAQVAFVDHRIGTLSPSNFANSFGNSPDNENFYFQRISFGLYENKAPLWYSLCLCKCSRLVLLLLCNLHKVSVVFRIYAVSIINSGTDFWHKKISPMCLHRKCVVCH